MMTAIEKQMIDRIILKDLSSKELTEFRKTLLEKYPNVFDFCFRMVVDEVGTYERSIANICPKYIVSAEGIKNFQKYINLFQEYYNYKQGNKVVLPSHISSSKYNNTLQLCNGMSNYILKNKTLPPEWKWLVVSNNWFTDSLIMNISNVDLDYVIKKTSENILIGKDTPANFHNLVVLALNRDKFTELSSLNICLTHIIRDYRSSANRQYELEIIIKNILRSRHIDAFNNDIFTECLAGWKSLENEASLKYQQNNHHQTKKRLDRLKAGYILMRANFRDSLSKRKDVLSKLDSFLIG